MGIAFDDLPSEIIRSLSSLNDDEVEVEFTTSNDKPCSPPGAEIAIGGRNTQWATTDDRHYQAIGRSLGALIPGAYNIVANDGKLYFQRFELKTDDLLMLPGTIFEEVVNEISQFWDKYEHYKKYGVAHRRGIIIAGPAGCGKSSTIKLIIADVVKRKGIVIPYTDSRLLYHALAAFREVQPDTPIVVVMEDLDQILKSSPNGQSEILNLLDGVHSDSLDRVVYLATTNYLEELERRITNRPSRFDRVHAVKQPDGAARKIYLEHLFDGKPKPDDFDIDYVVEETENLSFAHLKEIVVSTVIMGNKVSEVLERVKKMAEEVLPTGDEMETEGHRPKMGFIGMLSSRRGRG